MRRLTTLILFVLMLVTALEVALPRVASDSVAQGLRDSTGAKQVTAKVEKSPAIFMLGGSFDRIIADASDVKTDKLTFRNMHFTLTGVKVDMPALLTKRTVALQSVDKVEVTAVITQDELATYLNSSVKGIKNATVAITPGKVEVSSALTLGSFARMDVKLEGRVVGDRPNNRIKFVADRFWLNNTPVGSIGGALLTEVPLVDLKKLPFGVNVRDIVMEEGQVIIYTDNRD